MTALSDEELVAKYQAAGKQLGIPFADELFQRHYSRVALWCLRLAGDREAAADLAQEVFVKAWAHLDHFRADAKFSTWLYTIARNHCFNSIKSKGRTREDAVETEELDRHGSCLAGFDSVLERSQMVDIVREMMANELTPVEAKVMTLHFAEELPLAAISRLLQLDNASGAKAYIVSARRKLKIATDRWVIRSKNREPEKASHEE